ncbi:hypothetical protein [Snuella lapsa]|uniref:Uncharacterized protein n=1 Tax=Snuella lapsa TaxID=870481 RepID=A0ABP6Y8E0_9FLAO
MITLFTNFRQISRFLSCISFTLLFSFSAFGEGTPQLSPTVNDLVLLSIASFSGVASDFAYYGTNGTTQGLCFEVKDASEIVYLGLGLEVNADGNTGTSPGYSFRIVNSSGMVVHTGAVTSGNANGTNYNQLVNGPNIGTMTGGYNITNSQYVFNPTAAGTYCIEFDANTFTSTTLGGGFLKNFDISIANVAGNVIPGRLYSQNWALRTPCNSSFGCTGDFFAKAFEGKVYVLTDDNFVESIDFAGSGFRGLGFKLAFNGSGPGTSGDPVLDRRSLNGSILTNPDFKIFVNDPDPNCYDAPVLGDIIGSPSIVNQSISCDAMSNFCVDVTVSEPGLIQVLFDFNLGDEAYTDGTTDRILTYRFVDGGPLTHCIPWDGLDGLGNAVDVNSSVPILVTYYQGEVHFMKSDLEYNNPGFVVALEHPISGNFQGNHYWDDTNIDASGDDDANIDMDNNPATNPPGMGLNPPFVELSGQTQPAHIWNRNTTSYTIGYGENNVINTWWFGHASVEGPLALTPCPVVTCDQDAGTNGTLQICEGETVTEAELFASLGGTPDAGGTWSPVLAGAGTYTYTVSGAPDCPDATATVTVSEQAAPDAGTNGTLQICEGETVTEAELFASLGGTPDAGGTWSPVLAGAGTYTYTVSGAPDCPDATATVTVMEQVGYDLWVYLEGSLVDDQGQNVYNNTTMRTSLNDLRLLPGQTGGSIFTGTHYIPALGATNQSYNINPWSYDGGEGPLYDSGGVLVSGDAGYPSTVTDWVLVSFRSNPEDGTEFLCKKAALLHNDGHLEFVGEECCTLDQTQSYYVVIEHRNHLIVMSHQAVPIVNGVLTYDFRNQQSYINDPVGIGYVGQKQITTGVYAMFAGNGDQGDAIISSEDTDINSNDFNMWSLNKNMFPIYHIPDYDMNGDINSNDFNLWEKNENTSVTSVKRD